MLGVAGTCPPGKSHQGYGRFTALRRALSPSAGGLTRLPRSAPIPAMIVRIAALVMVCTAALAAPADAQLRGEWVADNLRTGCEPMALHASSHAFTPHDDENLEERLRTAAESRLRAARLYEDPPPRPVQQKLVIRVLVTGPEGGPSDTSRWDVSLYRWARNTGYGQIGPVIVWHWGAIGGVDHIVSSVSEMVDRFLVEYLRANPECG